MKIVVHALVKNEENFVWYALNSIVNYVDEIKVGFDSGASDTTEEIIKKINSPKLEIKKYDIHGPDDVTIVIQKMLDETNADWIFILDGDEIWNNEAIVDCMSKINNSNYEAVAIPNYMLIGDIFHYQEEIAGKYKIGSKVGHFNIRAIRKTPGLHLEGIYPNEAYVTKDGIMVQNLPKDKILFLDKPYLHASFLQRTSKENGKIKYEIGEEFPKDFYYPEVFFRNRPEIVPFAFNTMDSNFKLNAFWQTPLKKFKRRITGVEVI